MKKLLLLAFTLLSVGCLALWRDVCDAMPTRNARQAGVPVSFEFEKVTPLCLFRENENHYFMNKGHYEHEVCTKITTKKQQYDS